MKTLKRAVKILDYISDNPLGVTSSQLESELNTSKSTMHRTLQSLENLDIIQSTNEENQKLYKIGLKVLKYSHAFINTTNLPRISIDYMEELMSDTGHNVQLAVQNGTEILYINTVLNQNYSRFFTPIGKKAPMYCTALGKAILAFQSETKREDILNQIEFEAHTDNTITSLEEFREELFKTRENGYAVDNSEFEEGVRCVGAPIMNHSNQVVGAISVADSKKLVPVSDFPKLGNKVRSVANEISTQLGYIDRQEIK